MKKTFFSLLTALLALLTVSVANAATTFYTTEASFEASHFSGSLEQFDFASLAALNAVAPTNGLTITSSNNVASISGGVFHDRVTRSSGNSTTFEFGSSVNAFGGLFDLGVAGFGQGLEFTFQAFFGATEVVSQQLTSNGFFGFITDTTTLFNRVILTAGSSTGSAETYTLDDLRYGLHNPSAVPVPAALFLFAPALLGFFGLRRKATLAA